MVEEIDEQRRGEETLSLDAVLQETAFTTKAQCVLSALDSDAIWQRHDEIMNTDIQRARQTQLLRIRMPRYTDTVRGLFAAVWYEVTRVEGSMLELFNMLGEEDLSVISRNLTVQESFARLIPLYFQHPRRDDAVLGLINAYFRVEGCTREELDALGLVWNLSERDHIDSLVFLFKFYLGWYNPAPPERKFRMRYRLIFLIDELEALLACSSREQLHFMQVLTYLFTSLDSHFTLWLNTREQRTGSLREIKQVLGDTFLTTVTHDLITVPDDEEEWDE